MRYTIRDLLWLTVVVALVVGWWADRRGSLVERSRLVKEANKWQIRYEDLELK
jgi:hypothetical protein